MPEVSSPVALRSMEIAHRVLILDMDTSVRRRLVTQLRLLDWQVCETDVSSEALTAFAREPANLVLVGLHLPGIDAFEIAQRLRSLRGGRAARIVALSRTDTVELLQRCLHPCSPFDLYLQTPLRRNVLLELSARLSDRPHKASGTAE